ncbi:MAG: PrgI family protein [Patescibacteria group bacterium]
MPEKFVVPQFIDAEDKILGPITVRQFLICLGAVLVLFIEYKILTFVFFILAAIFTGGLAAVFAFIKINGQPFHIFFVNFLQTASRPQLRVWDKTLNNTELKLYVAQKQERVQIMGSALKARPESSRLRDLALTVNTGGVYNAEE